MRVTRESLLRIAKETAQERAYNDPDIIAAYLTGSLLNTDPMLGGTADIDVVFVHKSAPTQTREFVNLTPDFHLDISRRAKEQFSKPRELRGDPWLGYEIYDPILLYEREKFFDFVQASLRAGFDFEQPRMTLARCRRMLSHGRQIWFDLNDVSEVTPRVVKKYMKSLFHALNAVVELSGPPLQERRLLLEFPARAEAVGKPEMTATAFALSGASQAGAAQIESWLADWNADFKRACEKGGADARIHPARFSYYDKAVRALLKGTIPLAAFWPLFHAWTLSAETLASKERNAWQNAAAQAGFDQDGFAARVAGLDQFMDEIEIFFEEIARENGMEEAAGI